MTPADSSNDSLLSGIRRHLEGLKGTRDGMVLYNLIERGLKRFGQTGQIERAFVNFVTSLLGRYAKDPTYDAATRIKARLIQQRLALHMASATATQTPPSPAAQPPKKEKAAAPTPTAAAKSQPLPKKENTASALPPRTMSVHDITPDTASPIETLEHQLVERVTETLTTEGALESPPTGSAESLFDEFGDLKEILVKGLDELISERRALIRRIDGATAYLKALESDRRRMKEEIASARKHSSADELTGLPKRDMFVRGLEAEVGRVRRYGFSFALALIDVDDLADINETHGRDFGDAVLRCYASEILSRFRAYDLVSRYGDDEFAVLFPNTQKDGALRALEKAQKTVATTYVSHGGRSLRLPSFSSVLTVYSQGEKPAQLLKRAAEALHHAKFHGRAQIVVSLPSS